MIMTLNCQTVEKIADWLIKEEVITIDSNYYYKELRKKTFSYLFCH